MSAGKSLDLLKVAHNYKDQGREVLLMTPAIDTRNGEGVISSRVGLQSKAIALSVEDSPVKMLNALNNPLPDCILVDEAQFLTRAQVDDFAWIVDFLNIPVICYGLRTDFQGNLFEGSQALMCLADSIEEIKTICAKCNHKAIMNLRTVNGKPVTEGDQIVIGDTEYISLCRKHWKEATNSLPF